MTLEGLTSYGSVSDALTGLAAAEPLGYETRAAVLPGERICFMWEADAGWATGDPDIAGPRSDTTPCGGGGRGHAHWYQ